MEIKNAYIVYIDFDGDIASKYGWGKWLVFAGKNALEEVKTVVAEALKDLMNHEKAKNRDAIISVYDEDVPIADVLLNSQLLEAYIDCGGNLMGNWEISIYKTDE